MATDGHPDGMAPLERLHAALAGGGAGTLCWNLREDLAEWDEVVDGMLGLAPAVVTRSATRFLERVHVDDRAALIEQCRRCRDGGADFDHEFRVVQPGGGVRWLHGRGRTQFVDGRPAWMVGLCWDVSTHRAELEALRESRERLRLLADNINQLAWTLGADGQVLWVNRRWSDFFGHTLAEPDRWTWPSMVHEGDRPRVVGRVQHCLQTGEPYEGSFRVHSAGRGVRWLLTHLVPIRDEAGRLSSWFGTATDITAQRVAEDALRRRERELRTLTDNSPDIISRLDTEHRHVYVNAAVERVTGQPRERFIGRTNRELGMPEALCVQWEQALQQVIDSGRRGEIAFSFDAPHGTRHFDAVLVPEFDPDGRVVHVLCVTHDRTAERQSALALQAINRRKDEFIATLAHELRNPLAPIRNGLSVLQQQGLPEPTKALLSMMGRHLDHVVHLIDDLLDISRINSGKVSLRRQRIRLAPVVERAIEATLPLVDAGGHALTLDLPPQDVWLDADPDRLAQVLSNLLANAAKYTPQRGRIGVRVARVDGGVEIAVTDTGDGIPTHRLSDVFEMFTQIEGSPQRAHAGLGIGLALVKRLVEKHGGEVRAHSQGLGRGSCFVVRLPCAPALDTGDDPLPAGPVGVDSPDGPQDEPPTGRRVLVVDDNADAAESLAMYLGLLGHEVRTVGDGPAALETAQAGWRPDVAIVDIGLPGFDGYELARRWRCRPEGAATLLVALTGWGSAADKQRAAGAGFDHHLTKPVEPGAIEPLLRRLQTRSPDPGPPAG